MRVDELFKIFKALIEQRATRGILDTVQHLCQKIEELEIQNRDKETQIHYLHQQISRSMNTQNGEPLLCREIEK